MQAAVKAKTAGSVLQITDPDVVRGCRDLGDAHVDTAMPGARGRFGIRDALLEIGRARGASHVQYSGYVLLLGSNAQREHGHFYDCTTPAVAPAAAGAASADRPAIVYSAQLELLPVGSLHFQAPGQPQPLEGDTAAAYGVSGSLEWLIGPYTALGVNPGVVLGLKGDADNVSATELDLRARLRVGKASNQGFGAHVYGTLGASWIVFPEDTPTSSGAVVGFGLTVSHPVEHAAFITVEVGYQFGFQNITANDVDIEAASRLFHIALGIGGYP